jgi:hypothetical protein
MRIAVNTASLYCIFSFYMIIHTIVGCLVTVFTIWPRARSVTDLSTEVLDDHDCCHAVSIFYIHLWVVEVFTKNNKVV